MRYDNVKSPEELMIFMDEHIEYGFKGKDGKIYTMENDEEFEYGCQNEWVLASPEELIQNGYGHCWDQVELERDWFSKHGYVVKTIYIYFQMDHENPYTTHTYLIYENDGKFCLFEHSDYLNRGIWKFDTYKDAIFHQMKNHIKMNNNIEPLTKDKIECLRIYEYDKPSYGIGMFEFMDHVIDNGTAVL